MRLVILVVDDQRPILEIFARAMRSRHEVILETSGRRAFEILRGERELDAIFLDMMLPDMSGAEILRELRIHAPARLERIVIATGAMGIPGIEELLEDYRVPTTGARLPLLEKPYDIKAIEDALRRFTMNFAPKGPTYTAKQLPTSDTQPQFQPMRPPHRSAPKLPDYGDDDEVSKVTQLADAHDPLALAIRDLRREQGEDRLRIGKIEAHFEDGGEGKRGLVRQIDANVAAIRNSFTFIKVSIPLAAVLIGGLVWLIAAVNRPPPPERVDYERIVREVAKQK